jgi:hypothetical protein
MRYLQMSVLQMTPATEQGKHWSAERSKSPGWTLLRTTIEKCWFILVGDEAQDGDDLLLDVVCSFEE